MVPIIFGVCYGIILLLSIWSQVQVSAFINKYSSISGPHALNAFKELARTNMKLALVLIPLYGVGLLLTVAITFQYGLQGMLAVLLVNAVIGGLGAIGMGKEKKVRSLPVANEELEREYKRVAESWVKKATPDF